MLIIPCPICGPRPEPEFTYAGEAHIARPHDPAAVDNPAWTEFLYARTNPKGEHAERWRHTHGCGRFFNAVRNTVTDRFVATYPAGNGRPGAGNGRPGAGNGRPGAGNGRPGDARLSTGASLDAPETRTDAERWGPA